MSSHLDFLVIGAQKCATSWLYTCLAEHGQLRLPKSKRERFYIGGKDFQKNGPSWFWSRFPRLETGQKTGDVSVDYMFDPAATAAIKPFVAEPKFVCSIREPADRLISAYYWLLRKQEVSDPDIQNGIGEFLSSDNSFLDTGQEKRSELVGRGQYAPQLERFIDEFGANSLLVLDYAEIKSDPVAALNRVWRHLAVSPDVEIGSINRRPKQNSRSAWLLGIERRFGSFKIVNRLMDIAHQLMPAKQQSDPVIEAVKQRLRIAYRSDVEATRTLLESLPKQNQPTTMQSGEGWLCQDNATQKY